MIHISWQQVVQRLRFCQALVPSYSHDLVLSGFRLSYSHAVIRLQAISSITVDCSLQPKYIRFKIADERAKRTSKAV